MNADNMWKLQFFNFAVKDTSVNLTGEGCGT